MSEPSESELRKAERLFWVVAELSGPKRESVHIDDITSRANEIDICGMSDARFAAYVSGIRTRFLLANKTVEP